ncbi:MAG: hypothetical protein NVSMB12_15380 [Acidimicrobiales bacterium]
MVQRHPDASQTIAHRQRKARWLTAAGLVGAAAVTVGLLASAQSGGSSGGVATLDPNQSVVPGGSAASGGSGASGASAGPGGVSAADLGSRSIEPAPSSTVGPRSASR